MFWVLSKCKRLWCLLYSLGLNICKYFFYLHQRRKKDTGSLHLQVPLYRTRLYKNEFKNKSFTRFYWQVTTDSRCLTGRLCSGYTFSRGVCRGIKVKVEISQIFRCHQYIAPWILWKFCEIYCENVHQWKLIKWKTMFLNFFQGKSDLLKNVKPFFLNSEFSPSRSKHTTRGFNPLMHNAQDGLFLKSYIKCWLKVFKVCQIILWHYVLKG